MRLIDADEFTKEIYKCVMYGNTALIDKYEVLHRLNNAPTIEAEPVVHCKDCEHYNGEERYCKNDIFAKPNGYCFYGEKKDE